ncbi:hypothetical protein CR513_03660, partial [Mucuna pruriens]
MQWKKIDNLFLNFDSEPRNFRIGLGMNEKSICMHSSWLILLVIYNLPPWLCMKHNYMMLSMMISSQRQPANEIDVYLSLLVEDLGMLWDEVVDLFDGYCNKKFKMYVMLFCTILEIYNLLLYCVVRLVS